MAIHTQTDRHCRSVWALQLYVSAANIIAYIVRSAQNPPSQANHMLDKATSPFYGSSSAYASFFFCFYCYATLSRRMTRPEKKIRIATAITDCWQWHAAVARWPQDASVAREIHSQSTDGMFAMWGGRGDNPTCGGGMHRTAT